MTISRHRNVGVLVLAILAATTLLPVSAVLADPVSVVNALRSEGCGGQPSIGAPLAQDRALEDVARELSRHKLQDALARVGYRAASATSLHVRGSRDDDAVRSALSRRHCEAINDPRYEAVGAFGRDDETWIVLAVRRAEPPRLEQAATARRVVELVNAARAEARRCGDALYAAAQPLTLSATLTEAAAAHARDMASRGALGHQGSDGSQSGERIRRAGYAWRASGENIAAGQRDEDTVVAAWLASPGHCATLMAPYFTETGVAFALAPASNPPIYWTQVFATP